MLTRCRRRSSCCSALTIASVQIARLLPTLNSRLLLPTRDSGADSGRPDGAWACGASPGSAPRRGEGVPLLGADGCGAPLSAAAAAAAIMGLRGDDRMELGAAN